MHIVSGVCTNAECQTLAWKAGHKRECVPAAAGASTILGRQGLEQALGVRQQRHTAEQEGMLQRLDDLVSKQDWRGLVAMEDEAGRVARQAPLDVAGEMYTRLGDRCERMGEYARLIALHEEHKKTAEEVGDRAGVGRACGNLGQCYSAICDFEQAVAYCNKNYEIARELQVKAHEVTAVF